MHSFAGCETVNYDPLDPMGESGELIPSAERTPGSSRFREDILAQDKKDRKVRRKHRHTGLRFFSSSWILRRFAKGVVLPIRKDMAGQLSNQ